jgi:nucleoside-diphosphate-sugar epimerase
MSAPYQGKRILITGAYGFLGSALSKKLDGSGAIRYEFNYPFDPNFVTREIDYVFHFANRMGGISHVVGNGPQIMLDNILADANLIKACVTNGVKKFFFPSSFCVYNQTWQTGKGFSDYLAKEPSIVKAIHSLKEEDAIPANPDTYYGWAKLCTEKLLEAFSNKMQVRIARFVSIYGPGNHYKGGKEKVIAALCRKAVEAKDGGEIEVFGDGTQIRSFCYIDDCIDAILAIMEGNYDKPLNVDGPTTFNGPDAATVTEIANMVIAASGKQLRIKYIPVEVNGVDFRIALTHKIRNVTGWEPKINLREGIEKTYKWVEEQMK